MIVEIVLSVLLLVIVLFCNNMALLLVALLLSVRGIFHYTFNNKNKFFYITKASVFGSKKYCIEEREQIINKENKCPRELLFEELETLMQDLKPGITYVAGTHEKIIEKLKETNAYKERYIEILIKPYKRNMNITRIERNIKGKACKDCTKETCKTYQAIHDKKKKEIVKMYAIKIRKM